MQTGLTAIRCSTLLLLLVVALPVAAAAQETQDTMQLAPQLRAARAATSSAYMRLAAADAAAHYADDIIVHFGGEEIRGKDGASAWMQQTLQQVTSLRLGAASFKVAEAEVTERSSYVVATPDGEQEGSVETVWRRQSNGAWKIARMTVM